MRYKAPATPIGRGTAKAENIERSNLGGAVATADNLGLLHSHPVSAEQENINRLQSLRGTLTMPFNMEFFGAILGGGLTWVAKKAGWERVQTAIRSVTNAPFKALRDTTIGDLGKLPAHYTHALSEHAKEAGGLAAANWKPALDNATEVMTKTSDTINGHVGEVISPARKAVARGIDRFEGTGVGKKLHGMFDTLMHNREAACTVKCGKALGKAEAALTTEATGMFRKALNFITRKAPTTVPVGELAPVMEGLAAAKGLEGVARIDQLKSVSAQLGTLMESGEIKGELAKRASDVSRYIGKTIGSAQAIETYKSAAGESLKTMVKTVGKAAGRIPLFSALVGAGVVAGIGASILIARKDSKEAKQATAELTADLGEFKDSGFMKAIKAAHKKEGGARIAKTGLEVFGGAVDGALMTMPGAGGAAMMGAMMVPQLCSGLVPDNLLLGSYIALKKSESGELKFEKPEQKLELVKQLVAALPSVAAHGGIYNRLVTPVAAEMIKQEMPVKSMVQLLANDAAFNKFASEVNAKVQAQKAAATTVGHGEAKSTADAAIAKASESSKAAVSAAAEIPGKPAGRVMVGKETLEHQGTIATREKAIA